MPDLEQRRIDLRGGLQCIAAVDEQRGAVREHDRHPGRAGEPGQPCEALGAGRHVFALVLVGARHDEAVETARRQFLAQHRDPRRARQPREILRRETVAPVLGQPGAHTLRAPRRAPAGSGRRPARARTCRFPAGRRAPRRSARRRRPGRAPTPHHATIAPGGPGSARRPVRLSSPIRHPWLQPRCPPLLARKPVCLAGAAMSAI